MADEKTAVRKKRRTLLNPQNDGTVKTRGPFCPECQYEYVQSVAMQTQAMLAMESGLIVECPGCKADGIPVATFQARSMPPSFPRTAAIEPGVQRIIDSVFEVDYDKTWKILKENLVVGEGRTDHGTVTSALDHAENNARRAHQLYVNAKFEYERYLVDNEIVFSALWDEANGKLQAEKESGKRNKAITDADVRAKVAEDHPEQFRHHEMEKRKFDLTVKHLENFSDTWSSKCRSLQVILKTMRGGGVA